MVFQSLSALRNRTDEAIASTMRGFNEVRRLWVIAESLSDLANGDFEDGFANNRLRPDGIEKVLLYNELAWTPEEIVEHRECFG